METEDPVYQEIHRPDGDHEESPEDERVRKSADVVRPLQELALSEIDHELVAHAPPRVVDARLVATESHVLIEAPRAPEEGTEAKGGEHEQHRAPRNKRACWRDHYFKISSAMTSFMISLVPS